MKKVLYLMKKHTALFLKSIVIGATMRVPGMSGGTTAIILGIYDKLLAAAGGFFKNVKENLVYLSVFVAGGALAFLAFNSLVYRVTTRFPAESAYFFVGIILFGIPALLKESGILFKKQPQNQENSAQPNQLNARPNTLQSNQMTQSSLSQPNTFQSKQMNRSNLTAESQSKFSRSGAAQPCSTQSKTAGKHTSNDGKSPPRHLAVQILLDLLPFLCGAAAVVAFSILQKKGVLRAADYTGAAHYAFIVGAGFFAGIALVLPGLSFTYFLTVIGLMDTLSESISLSSISLSFLIMFGLGVIIGVVATAKVLGSLIEKHRRGTYLCVIGFLIGSVVMLLTDPKYVPQPTQIFFCALFFVLGSALILSATHFASKRDASAVGEKPAE